MGRKLFKQYFEDKATFKEEFIKSIKEPLLLQLGRELKKLSFPWAAQITLLANETVLFDGYMSQNSDKEPDGDNVESYTTRFGILELESGMPKILDAFFNFTFNRENLSNKQADKILWRINEAMYKFIQFTGRPILPREEYS